MSKKIVLISDTHKSHWNLDIPECDILIHCGDGTNLGTEEELRDLNNWFGTLNVKRQIIYVPGNHDLYIEENSRDAQSLLNNSIVLIDETVEIAGLKIHGTPYVPTFYDWAFMKPDLNLQTHWDLIPENLDILATHGPAWGILDRNSRGYPCGSQTLYLEIAKKKPKYHVFGHIHEDYGMKILEPTKHINCAVCPYFSMATGNYVENQPVVIEI